MPRLSLKPDSSFFRKIVVGAVGARAVRDDMAALGHNFVELERGSTDSKLWKNVKRKRVRIPDLVCLRCGQRIESRAKTRNELAMSHSEQAERTWDFGMVPQDWIAFPVCEPVRETERTTGRLSDAIQQESPELHYAVTLIWSFLDSWISKHWELNPTARFPAD